MRHEAHHGTRGPSERSWLALLGFLLIGCADENPELPEPPAPECDPAAPDGVTRSASEQRNTERLIAIADAAEPTTLLDVYVVLDVTLPDLSWMQTPEEQAAVRAERAAVLTPVQDSVAARVRELGGDEISRTTLVPGMRVVAPARTASDIACLPYVAGVEPSNHWYEVVPRPWDRSSVGSNECPTVTVDGANTCPEHCYPIRGTQVDPAGSCASYDQVVTCAVSMPIRAPGFAVCTRDDGTRWLFSTLTPKAPSFAGWETCDEADGFVSECL